MGEVPDRTGVAGCTDMSEDELSKADGQQQAQGVSSSYKARAEWGNLRSDVQPEVADMRHY